jgi:hypothetical protein
MQDATDAPKSRDGTGMLRWSGSRHILKADAEVDQNRTAIAA